jgi:hypothetical protein
MFKNPSINFAKRIFKELLPEQGVILFAVDNDKIEIVTYGKNKKMCDKMAIWSEYAYDGIVMAEEATNEQIKNGFIEEEGE